MVMSVEPLLRALRSLPAPGRVLLLSARGRCLDQALAGELAAAESLTLVCGRYEGIDARFEELARAEPVAVGDFVLSGGESAALCLMESVARLLPGFMGQEESACEESFSQGLLEYPHYTRPPDFEGRSVPEVLLSGDHQRIAAERRRWALEETLRHRPDLLDRAPIDIDDLQHLKQLPRTRLGRNLYLGLIHYPVVNKLGETVAVSLTNLDIHDIARVCRSYGLARYYLATPLEDQQRLALRLLAHWKSGLGRSASTSRLEAVDLVEVVPDLAAMVESIRRDCGQEPFVVGTSAREQGTMLPVQVAGILREQPVLLLFGTGHGLAPEMFPCLDGVLRPLRCLDRYNHLAVRSAVSATVDRILGDVW
jgi:tRNA (guanine37-N1)-methyltransferase